MGGWLGLGSEGPEVFWGAFFNVLVNRVGWVGGLGRPILGEWVSQLTPPAFPVMNNGPVPWLAGPLHHLKCRVGGGGGGSGAGVQRPS